MRFDPDRVALVVIALAGLVTVLAQTVKDQQRRLASLEAAQISQVPRWRVEALEAAMRRHNLLSEPFSNTAGGSFPAAWRVIP
jgi:hypothetical protein